MKNLLIGFFSFLSLGTAVANTNLYSVTIINNTASTILFHDPVNRKCIKDKHDFQNTIVQPNASVVENFVINETCTIDETSNPKLTINYFSIKLGTPPQTLGHAGLEVTRWSKYPTIKFDIQPTGTSSIEAFPSITDIHHAQINFDPAK